MIAILATLLHGKNLYQWASPVCKYNSLVLVYEAALFRFLAS